MHSMQFRRRFGESKPTEVESPFVSFTDLLTGTFLILIVIVVYLALNQGISDEERLEIKVGELLREIGELEAQRDELILIVSDRKTQIKVRAEELSTIEMVIGKLTADRDQLSEAYEVLDARWNATEQQVSEARADFEQIEIKAGEVMKEVGVLEDQRDELVFEIEHMGETLARRRAEVERIELKIGELSKEVGEIQNDYDQAVLLLGEREGLVTQSTTNAQALEVKLGELKEEFGELVERRDELVLVIDGQLRSIENAARSAQIEFLRSVGTWLESAGMRIEIDEDRTSINVSHSVRFEHNKAVVAAEHLASVRWLAYVLQAHLECSGGESWCVQHDGIAAVLIEGHADQSGSDDVNWPLSAMRAYAVYEQIVEAQPRLRDIRAGGDDGPPVLAIAAYGSTRPLEAPDWEGKSARNRRIEIRFVFKSGISR